MLRQILEKRLIILYGVSLGALLFLLKWLELRILIVNHSFEIYVGAIAIIFTILGMWLAIKLFKSKTVIIEKEIRITDNDIVIDEAQIEKIGLSKREIEVLRYMSEGMTNNEIAEKMFLSLSTVKSHSQNLFQKLEVARRTQAIDRARKLRLIK